MTNWAISEQQMHHLISLLAVGVFFLLIKADLHNVKVFETDMEPNVSFSHVNQSFGCAF